MCVSQVGDNLRAAQKSGRKIVGRGGGRPSPLRMIKPRTKPGSKTTIRSAIKSKSKSKRPSSGKLNTNDINLRL